MKEGQQHDHVGIRGEPFAGSYDVVALEYMLERDAQNMDSLIEATVCINEKGVMRAKDVVA